MDNRNDSITDGKEQVSDVSGVRDDEEVPSNYPYQESLANDEAVGAKSVDAKSTDAESSSTVSPSTAVALEITSSPATLATIPSQQKSRSEIFLEQLKLLTPAYGPYLWPLSLFVCLMIDENTRRNSPQTLFGYDGGDLFLGKDLSNFFRSKNLAMNPFLISSGLATVSMDEAGYWYPTAIAGAAYSAFEVISIYDEYKTKKSNTPAPAATQANQTSHLKKALNLGFNLYRHYAAIRLLEYLMGKIVDLTRHRNNYTQCSDRDFIYLNYLADYVCTLCGSWSTAPSLAALNNGDTCFSALLSITQNADTINAGLKQIGKSSAITQLDLAQTSWLNWRLTQLVSFFENVNLASPRGLKYANFSANLPINYIDTLLIASLSAFIRNKNMTKLVFNQLNAGELLVSLMDAIGDNSAIQELELQYQALTADHIQRLMQSDGAKNWTSLNVAYNLITELYGNFSANFALKRFNLAGNPISGNNFTRTAASLQVLPLESLDLSAMEISSETAGNLLPLFSNTTLREFVAQSALIDDDGFFTLSNGFAVSLLQSLNLANNAMTDLSFQANVAFPDSLSSLDLSNTQVGENSLIVLFNSLFDLKTRTLNLSFIPFSSNAIIALALFIVQNTVIDLNLSNCKITDDLLLSFKQAITNLASLKKINLSNNPFSSTGAKYLFDVMRNQTDAEIDVSYTSVSDAALDYIVSENLMFRGLSFDSCQLTEQCLGSAQQVLLDGRVHRLSMENNNLGDICLTGISSVLTDYPLSLDAPIISNDFKGDTVLSHSKSKTPRLNYLNLRNTGMSQSTNILFRQLQPVSSLNFGGLELDNATLSNNSLSRPTAAIDTGLGFLFAIAAFTYLIRIILDFYHIKDQVGACNRNRLFSQSASPHSENANSEVKKYSQSGSGDAKGEPFINPFSK